MTMFDAHSSAATERPATCPVHANKDHPAIKPARVGILVANLGTPDALGAGDLSQVRSFIAQTLPRKGRRQ